MARSTASIGFEASFPAPVGGSRGPGERSDMTTGLHPPLVDLLFQTTQAGLCLLDSEGKVCRANAEWRRLLGRSFEALDGKSVPAPLEAIRRLSAGAGWKLTVSPVALDGGDGLLITVHEQRAPGIPGAAGTFATTSEAGYRLLFNSITEAFALHEVVLDDRGEPCDYRFLEVNPAFERLTGLAAQEVLGKRVTEVLPEADPEWIQIYGKVALSGESVQFERYEPTLGKHYEVFAFCPTRLQFSVLFLDVTHRKRAEEALRRSEERYRKLVAELPIGIFHARVHEGCTFLNGAGERIVGLSEAEALGTGWTRVLDLSDAAILSSLRADVSAMKGRFSREFRLRRPDGQSVWVKAWVTEVPGLEGAGELVGALVDVTDQKVTEKALQESEELHRAVVTNMAEGVLVQDTKVGVVAANPAAETILGLRAGAMRGRPPWDPRDPNWRVIHEDGSPFIAEDYPPIAALRTGEPQSNVVAGFRRPDGSFAWVKGTSIPLRDQDGRAYRVLSTFSDITERRALREQLTVASRLAAMGTLVAGVAHEINNPLAGVMASQQIVGKALSELGSLLRQDGPLDREVLAGSMAEAVDVLGDADAGANRIARIIRDLSVFGRPSPHRTRVRLLDVVRSAIRWLPASVPSQVTIRVEPGEPPEILASEGLLEQVVVNLVTNAALAIPEGRSGEILIQLGVGDHGMARLDVTDNGTGIVPELMERIFNPFFTTREVGKGTGLGLPICHSIVVAHGGTLTAASVPGEGSTFRVELPALPLDQGPTNRRSGR